MFERLSSDLIYLRAGLRTLRRTAPIVRNPRRILPIVIDELADAHGDKPALISARETLSYRTFAERSRRYLRWALQQGIAKGDVVALLMPNRPEYLAIWLGLTRAGATVALLNTNLTGTSLAYCIDIVAARHVIVAAELLGALEVDRRLSQSRAEGLAARRSRPAGRRPSAHRSCGRGARRRAARSRQRKSTSPSRTRRCSSTPPARRECRRPPTSITIG